MKLYRNVWPAFICVILKEKPIPRAYKRINGFFCIFQGIYCLSDELLASQEGLWSIDLVFFTHIPRILILSKFFYSPTDAQVNCLKNSFKIYIKIDIKTAPTCFSAVTPSSGSTLLVFAKDTVCVVMWLYIWSHISTHTGVF
jgi:hypothetical protein